MQVELNIEDIVDSLTAQIKNYAQQLAIAEATIIQLRKGSEEANNKEEKQKQKKK